MGRRSRFRGLEASKKNLRVPGQTTQPQAPAGSILGEYQKFKAGEKNISYTRATSSNPGTMEEMQIKLFGLGATNNTALCRVSKRALDLQTGVAEADLGLSVSDGAWDFEGDFIPAKAIIKIIGTSSTEATSKITGNKYRSKGGSSGTLPFGQATATNYVAQCKAIADKVNTGAARGVSFLPEDILDVL
jgi:hypothetical protein